MPFDQPRTGDQPPHRFAPPENERPRRRDGNAEGMPNLCSVIRPPVLIPRPVTRVSCDGPGALFSWEVVYAGGSASGVSRTEHRARQAVTRALHEHDGQQGIVQRACLGAVRGDERDQYDYGHVVAHARVVNGIVEWALP